MKWCSTQVNFMRTMGTTEGSSDLGPNGTQRSEGNKAVGRLRGMIWR